MRGYEGGGHTGRIVLYPAVSFSQTHVEMTLRGFVSAHRDEILDLCIRKLQLEAGNVSRDEAKGELEGVLDEVILALGDHEEGTRRSPLPERSATACRHGRQRQQLSYSIERISRDFGSISDSVGEIAGREGLSFAADQYRIFNLCLDTAIGDAIEQYWKDAVDEETRSTTERVGVFAHELRNALASARMSYSLLQTGQFGINSRTGEVLGRALARADMLVSRALLEVQVGGHIEAQRKPLRVADVLYSVRDSMVLERGVVVVVEADDSVEADADERLLSSAVSNLVQNGVKFSRANGTVMVRSKLVEQAVCIEVEDECGGLSPGAEDEIFRPFVRKGLDRRGLGLGLTITKEAIEAQAGRLTVRNLPGKGCIFGARIPCASGRNFVE